MALFEAFVCRLKTSPCVFVIHCDFEWSYTLHQSKGHCLSEVQEGTTWHVQFPGLSKRVRVAGPMGKVA